MGRNTKTQRGFFDSVKNRLMLIILLVMAVPLIIAIVISYVTSHNEAIENMKQVNTAQVHLVEHDFRSVVDQNMQILQTIANSVSARKVLKGELDVESVAEWLGRTDDEVGDGNTSVIANADGMQICRAKGDCVDVSDREYFQKAKETGKFYVSDQNISKTSGKRICTFIHPIFDLDGTFIGTVQRNYDLDSFTQLAKSEIVSEKQDIFIGDNNGDLIAHTSMELNGGEPVNFSTQKWYTESRSNAEATGSYDSKFNGGNWIMSYEREPLTGWVTVVASDKGVALASSNRMLMIIIVVGVIMLIVGGVIAVMMANSFTGPIIAVNRSISRLAVGEFESLDDVALTARKDEFGDIVNGINDLIAKLTDVIEGIKKASATVSEQAGSLSDTAGQISSTTDDVSRAVDEMARGATEQADSIEKATENVSVLSSAIQNVAGNAESLASGAAEMDDASHSSAEALRQLSGNMDRMGASMADISETMKATNEAVQNVNEKVDGITAIATQTNLLALNASIEAARAGDAGRGFAVVAEEIGKLATESSRTAEEIRQEMGKLLDQANVAIKKTGEMSEISTNVSNVLDDAVGKINMLIDGVGSTVDGVNTISGLTEECDASKAVIVDAMSSLSAISEENAASTQETSASMEELNATISMLSESAGSLNDVALQLDDELKFFKI